MTGCREIERLFLADAPESERRAHRAGCPSCDALALDVEHSERLTSSLQRPAWSGSLREALLAVPLRTLDCDAAGLAIAASLEGELDPSQRVRLEFHVSRCEGCREAFETLLGLRELQTPKPAPWVIGRLSAAKPARARSRWRGLLDPRAAIGLAYAAALVVMLAGFNPADLARKAGGQLRSETRDVAAVASVSFADRAGAFQDRAARALAVWRGRAGGYGRAILSNAIALVLKSEEPSRRPPSRPRNGDGRSAPKDETAIPTWSA
jgi:hypothetical protein